MQVGADGSTTTESGKELVDAIEYSEGLEHQMGYQSNVFINEVEAQTCTLVQPRVLITDQKITMMTDILPVLEGCVQAQVPLLIISLDVSGEAMTGLTLNKQRGVLDVCAVKAPGFGDVR